MLFPKKITASAIVFVSMLGAALAQSSPPPTSGVTISGTLPAFAATPTFNIGTLNGASTSANQSTEIISLSTIATNTTGVATAAKQPVLGTAGSSSTDVITVQGITSGTAINTTPLGNVASGATDSGGPVKVGCIFTTTPSALSSGQRSDANCDSVGNWRTALYGVGSTNGIAGNPTSADAVATSGTSNSLRVVPFNYGFNGTTWDRIKVDNGTGSITGAALVVPAPSASIVSGITPLVTASALNSVVLKASAGNAYSASATNLTAVAGFLVLLNLTSSPADGAITPLACAPLPANGVASINYAIPAVYSTGVTAVVTSATTCFTKTTGVITAFMSGQAK